MSLAPDDAFAQKFLSADPGDDGDEALWPKGISKAEFAAELKRRLTGTEVIWVNPIVRVVFVHPEHLWHQGISNASWGEYVNGFLFAPTAIQVDQSALDQAYTPITDKANSKKGHLTPFFSKCDFTETLCFRCVSKDSASPNAIEVLNCATNAPHPAHSSLENPIKHTEPYAALFKLSGNVIWFIPSPIFSLKAAWSPLHQDYLVGAYLALAGTNRCACEKWKNEAQIREAINWATNLFFLRRIKDQGRELHGVLKQYAKQLHMLRLLQAPLGQISEALESMHESTQTLRSIMYDPHRSIFSVAPLVEKYFEEGRSCGYGKVIWKGVHKADMIRSLSEAEKPRHRHAAAAAVAVVVAHIFGMESQGTEDELELYFRVERFLTYGGPEFNDHRKTLSKLLGDPSNLLKCLKLCLTKEEVQDFDPVIKAHIHLKDCLLTPFKYAGDKPIRPLALILNDFELASVTIDGKAVAVSSALYPGVSGDYGGDKLFKDIPVPRYSDILSLISGVCVYAMAEEQAKLSSATLTCAETNCGGSIAIEFSKDIFVLEVLEKTFNLMKTVAREQLRQPQGNFRKPLLDFASMLLSLPAEDNKAFRFSYIANQRITMAFSPWECGVELMFEKRKFILNIPINGKKPHHTYPDGS